MKATVFEIAVGGGGSARPPGTEVWVPKGLEKEGLMPAALPFFNFWGFVIYSNIIAAFPNISHVCVRRNIIKVIYHLNVSVSVFIT